MKMKFLSIVSNTAVSLLILATAAPGFSGPNSNAEGPSAQCSLNATRFEPDTKDDLRPVSYHVSGYGSGRHSFGDIFVIEDVATVGAMQPARFRVTFNRSQSIDGELWTVTDSTGTVGAVASTTGPADQPLKLTVEHVSGGGKTVFDLNCTLTL